MLSEVEANRLVFGYARHELPCIIPVEITKLCYLFFNNVIYWKLNEKELENFVNYREINIHGPSFVIDGIKFKCAFTNQWNSQFSIECVNNTKTIRTILNLQCKKLLCKYKRINIYDKEHNIKTWPRSMIRSDECKSFTSLELAAKVTILEINGKTNTQMYDKIFINKDCKYEWNINGNLLDNMRKWPPPWDKYYYSPSFGCENNTNWGLYCCPFVDNDDLDGMSTLFRIGLSLFQLPSQIDEITVNVKYESNYLNIKGKKRLLFGIRGRVDFCLYAEEKDGKKFRELDELKIMVQIQIVDVIDKTGQRCSVPQSSQTEWNEYGIIT